MQSSITYDESTKMWLWKLETSRGFVLASGMAFTKEEADEALKFSSSHGKRWLGREA